MDYVKNIDSCRCLSLLLVVCTQKVEEFTAPVAGEYKLQCWGAGNSQKGGGYSYGDITLISSIKLYVCVGGQGKNHNGYKGGLGGYNGGGKGGDGSRINAFGNAHDYIGGSGGNGATHIGFHTGLLNKFESDYKTQLLLVAGGAGGFSQGNYGLGFGGGSEGGKPARIEIYDSSGTLMIPSQYGTSANQNSGYKFGEGQQGMTKSKHGNSGAEGSGGGGGGLYGGFSPQEEGDYTNWAGGGGSGYANTSLLTNAMTIAGDTNFPSPYGGMEKGHLDDDGACIVTQISF